MRSESEMLEVILGVARRQETVRAVILQGSRANPRITPDQWQDYDVVYLVRELETLTRDEQWLTPFGERIIMQTPERMQLPPPAKDGTFSYLMLFTDGNRIDLRLVPWWCWKQRSPDSLSRLLLDKDGTLDALPEPGESDYRIQPPTQQIFRDCCNEFWWTTTYVAKGLCRKEVTYSRAVMERVVRKMLDQMICWQVLGVHGPEVNPGKYGRHLEHYLTPRQWARVLKTFPDGSIPRTWKALFAMTELFDLLSTSVADLFELEYDQAEAHRVNNYLLRLDKDSIN